MIVRGVGAAALTVMLAAGACGGGSDAGDSPGTSGSTAARSAPAAGKVKLVKVAQLEGPVGMAVRKGDPGLYVIEQPGRVRVIRDGKADPRPVLDLSREVSGGNEQGLLGIAFSPDGRFLYLDFTDKDGHTHVTEWSVGTGGAVAAGSRREVLFQKQPFANHNGGQLAFGPDGHLYIALGDGGSAGDPQGNGQHLGTLLGKILRIDPRPAGAEPYGIPAGNPFVRRAGARPEIWAYGLRNPWRFAFDPASGDLWIGDVGQNAWEEVDRQPGDSKGGENYGWNSREGKHPFRGARPPAGAVEPVLDYPLGKGGNCSVIGGAVYRGSRVPAIKNHYLYGDFCAGWINALPLPGGKPATPRTLLTDVSQLSSFGVDQSGEVYVLTLNGTVSRIESA